MQNYLRIKKKINKFNKKIQISGDKSISIRWILFASLANGVSKAKNLLISEDVLSTIKAIKKEIDITDDNKLKAKYLVINGLLIKLFFAPTSCIVFIISLFE